MINVEDFISLIDNKKEQRSFRLATVVGLFESGKAKLQFDGEDIESGKEYSTLDSYTANIGDRVLLAVISGTYVVLGKVI